MNKIIQFTDELWDILDDIGDKVSEFLMRIESNPSVENKINVEKVAKGRTDFNFEIMVDGKWRPIKVGVFIRYFSEGKFTSLDINNFIEKYNKLRKGQKIDVSEEEGIDGDKVDIQPFKWNPKDVRSTFLSMVTETYPHGHEEEVVKFIQPAGLKKDKFGNYYKIIGKSETMFTSHLDTADRSKSKVTVYSIKKDGDEFLMSDGTTILGADDKSGVTVMLYMIAHNVPGIYYFFIGEERGGIGSSMVSNYFEDETHLQGVKRCVSFDRRNYFSVITEQIGGICCSDEFASELAKQYNANGMDFKLDPTGIFTDSASFVDQIPECTNISVGYFREHTTEEHQNITFLEKLCKASIKVDWESLPTVRKVGVDDDVMRIYGDFVKDFKDTPFSMPYKFINERGVSYLAMQVDEPDFDLIKEDFVNLAILFSEHDMDPNIIFEDDIIKVELETYYKKINKKWDRFVDNWNGFDVSGDIPEEDDYDEDMDTMDEMKYWIRKMFNANNINCEVELDDLDIITECRIGYRVKISEIINILNVVDRIKTDLLNGYYTEIELYEDKYAFPIFRFIFNYSQVSDKDENPFD